MKLGVIGLGRMGGNISLRLMKHGHECVVYDNSEKAVDGIVGQGAAKSSGLDRTWSSSSPSPRIVWVMLPSGKITEDTVQALGGMMEKGDIIIDGGNSMYKDDIRRAKALREKGIVYVDVGTSGGVWGLQRGYCMMIGGEDDAVTPSTRSCPPWRRAKARSRRPRTGTAATRRRSRAICIAARPAAAISSRWSITASNTE